MFKAAALTRAHLINYGMSSSSSNKPWAEDIVVYREISDLGQLNSEIANIQEAYSAQYGDVREIGIWSHSGLDGPIGTEPTSENPLYEGSTQMSIEGWGALNVNWVNSGGSCAFYGCNSGNAVGGQSFANKVSSLSNFRNVSVSGQTTSSYPSVYTDSRVTTASRSVGIYHYNQNSTYMVGGNGGQGSQSHWFMPGNYPDANPMEFNMNGNVTGYGFQEGATSN